jgi:NAD(P)-dependent dehydrogenase (short-subunit alcohol dehydrogenase family)
MNIVGKVAIVTGANRGFGYAITLALLQAGATKVYAAVRRPDLIAGLFDGDGRVVPIALDLTQTETITAAARKAHDVEILINNAAVLHQNNLQDDSAMADLALEFATNVVGPMHMAQAFVPLLRQRTEPAIININSIAALCPFQGVPTYAASKAAALSLTQSLRRELAPQKIPVFSVLPGPIDTDMAAWLGGRKAQPIEVAHEVLRKVQEGNSLDIFPDEGAKDFWATFVHDPASVLFTK